MQNDIPNGVAFIIGCLFGGSFTAVVMVVWVTSMLKRLGQLK